MRRGSALNAWMAGGWIIVAVAATAVMTTVSAADSVACPHGCSCAGLLVDCSYRAVDAVPIPFARNVERVDLQGNNITVIRRTDFEGLRRLRILQLLDNQIHTIERGAFQDLVSMERLRLNNNLLKSIPDLLFANMAKLHRLDLSHNKLTAIGRKTLRGSPLIKNLQIDNNELTCVDDVTFRSLKDMEILTLNANNLTSLGEDLFEHMPKLRVLRISDNQLACDCHLQWLARWLRRNPLLALFTRCSSPYHLRTKNLVDVDDDDFKCNDAEEITRNQDTCQVEPVCPFPCSCSDGIVDCRDKGLTNIPANIPQGTTELRLEQNQIAEVTPKVFAPYKRLKRIDLSNNQITKVAGDAFHGLKSLTSLVLYGNKITELPAGIFRGLNSLQLLLLNANKISCIRQDTFADLHNLNLLSLYDNNIQSLVNGTFNPLRTIQTLHLARNPFICDCNLRWLSEYLHRNPIETSGARCESPKRMQRKRIGQMKDDKFKCVEEHRTKLAGQCMIDKDCPASCVCEGTIVDCSGRLIKEIPNDIPMFTTELRLNDNQISAVKNTGIFSRLPNLLKLDLRHNEIVKVEDGAFHGANSIQDLLLTSNRLKKVSGKTFEGLTNVRTLMLRSNSIECISNDTFTDLKSVVMISLYDNHIRCIIQGAFDRLQSLSTLNLLHNPFHCNCHLGWLSDWLRKRNIVTGSPRCFQPTRVKELPIQEIPYSDFICDEETMDDSCIDQEPRCPDKCTCSRTMVRCSRAKLTEVPTDIPHNTTELYLDVNEISILPREKFSHLTNLLRLDLSNNKIIVLSNDTFKNLTKLSTLILSYNKLQCIHRDGLIGLKSLRILSLHGNDISMIPDGTFRDLASITHIALGANPLYCDCQLKWLSDWVKNGFMEPGIAHCAEPTAMRDKLILTTPAENFVCSGEIEPEILSKCDACYTFPCRNGATCKSIPERNFKCSCAPGYLGRHCEYVIDACYGHPCLNGGTCKLVEEGRFSCHCPAGFEGDRCELNTDDCLGHKCENSGVCRDLIDGYDCVCHPGYAGRYCEKKINFCSKEFNPCKNGATCLDRGIHYSCVCPEGFSGENCTENINDCHDHMCQNGGTCVDGVNAYKCECPKDYAGAFCEVLPMVVMLYPQTSPCQDHDCKNGVCFQPMGTTDYVCKCAPGFSGKRCEHLASLSFRDPTSFVEMAALLTKSHTNVTLVFATMQESGVLLYFGETQHLAVEIFRGRVRISYDVGNYPVSTMFSFEKVDDGIFHTVELLAIKKNFTMRIDGGPARSVINEGLSDYLDVQTSLFVGGVPPEVASTAWKQWHLRNTTSFNGCMKHLFINEKSADFSDILKQHKVTSGCPTYERPDPCQEHSCKKGHCVPLDDTHYECECQLGWGGEFCDQPPTCQKEQSRDFITEDGCRSRQMVKLSMCVGSCGDHCCRPWKTKKRKVRLVCLDGRSFTKDVDVVRKCECTKKCS